MELHQTQSVSRPELPEACHITFQLYSNVPDLLIRITVFIKILSSFLLPVHLEPVHVTNLHHLHKLLLCLL